MTREEWLLKAVGLLVSRYDLEIVGKPIKVSVGFPKGSRKLRGQCWDPKTAGDQETHHIFVSPPETEPVEVLQVLLHELIHVEAGVQYGHKSEFSRRAKARGFLKPWTTTPLSLALAEELKTLTQELPAYPHVSLLPAAKKQATRMRLWECQCREPVKIRRAGELNALCLDCDERFELKEE